MLYSESYKEKSWKLELRGLVWTAQGTTSYKVWNVSKTKLEFPTNKGQTANHGNQKSIHFIEDRARQRLLQNSKLNLIGTWLTCNSDFTLKGSNPLCVNFPFYESTLPLHPERFHYLLDYYLRETVGSIKPSIKGEIKNYWFILK